MTVATTEQGPHKRYRRLRFPSFDADVWANKNPLLQKGELGHEKDTGRFKVGDGVTYWLDLPYNSVGDPAKVNGHNVLEIIAGKNVEIEQNGNVLTIGASGVGYSKQEIDDKFTVANAQIDANAVAIAKTRDDYMSADTDIMTIINNHAEELTTLRNDIDELGDDVAGIQAKIPETASGSNPLITKQQLLDEEMDIRDDLNESVSELQTQITAQATAIAGKQEKLIAGDNIVIGSDGKTISATGAGGGAGLSFIVYDTLPETGESGIIYLVPKDGEAPDVYDEYVWITATSTFELIGSTQVDLTDYAKKEDLNDYLPLSGGTLTGALSIRNAAGTLFGAISNNGGGLQFNYGSTNNAVFRYDGSSLYPATNKTKTLGDAGHIWSNVYATKLNNGADIAIPTEGGTLARLEDLENIEPLPDQTGNAGKVLTTDGETASWQEPSGGTTITLKEYDE